MKEQLQSLTVGNPFKRKIEEQSQPQLPTMEPPILQSQLQTMKPLIPQSTVDSQIEVKTKEELQSPTVDNPFEGKIEEQSQSQLPTMEPPILQTMKHPALQSTVDSLIKVKMKEEPQSPTVDNPLEVKTEEQIQSPTVDKAKKGKKKKEKRESDHAPSTGRDHGTWILPTPAQLSMAPGKPPTSQLSLIHGTTT